LQVAGEVFDWGDVAESLFQSFSEKPIEGVLLDCDQIGELLNFGESGERNAVT